MKKSVQYRATDILIKINNLSDNMKHLLECRKAINALHTQMIKLDVTIHVIIKKIKP
jgi:hypothetical protein